METNETIDRPAEPSVEINTIEHDNDAQTSKEKRVVKLTAKALADKLGRLQNERKTKLNKAASLRNVLNGLIEKGNVVQAQCVFDDFIKVCDESKGVHECLMGMLPDTEQEKHDVWFKAKMIANNELISKVQLWLSNSGQNVSVGPTGSQIGDGINPEDSVSNATSKRSGKSAGSKSSTTSSVRIKAQAEKAALLARIAALKEKHALEEQEQQIKRKLEQQELDTMLAETAARLSVLEASDNFCSENASDTMNSYLTRETQSLAPPHKLDPMASEFKCAPQSKPQQTQEWTSSSTTPPLLAGALHQASQQPTTRPKEWSGLNKQKTEINRNLHQQSTQLNVPNTNQRYTGGSSSGVHWRNNTTSLVQQQHLISLPARNIPLFDGDPLQYVSFMRAFEQGVEEKASKSDCLYYLEQFTRGQPRELVRSCLYMTPELGYDKAKQLVQEHFGCKYKIAVAYIEKALSWAPIKNEDVNALQAYSLFLRGCCNVMEELQYMHELDMPSNIRAIVLKLPFKLRDQWRTAAHDLQETTGNRALVNDLVRVIERHVQILSDPLYGNISDSPSATTGQRAVNRPRVSPEQRTKGKSFATTITPVKVECTTGSRTISPRHNSASALFCAYCSQSHLLEHCQQFKCKKHRDKINFLKEKHLCFGCLSTSHMSRDCEKRLTCKICSQSHPTVLHINKSDTASMHKAHVAKVTVSTSTQIDKDITSHSFASTAETCGHTGAGADQCLLSIVPVQVKSIKSDQVILTYAFLDPGSSATFCSEQLMQKLHLTGKRTQFLLCTMGQERVVPAYSLTGLEVSGINGNVFHELPQTLTQKKMPVNTDNIVTAETLVKWPYLVGLTPPKIEANVDLLIGSNAPRLLEPWEVINSHGNGPYAIRTVLGWVINGLVHGEDSCLNAECRSAVVNRVSVCKLEKMLNNQYNHDFNERVTEEKGLSREDKKFMDIVERSVRLKDNHYQIKLPLKKDVHLPNNFAVAKQRLTSLKRKFLQNEHFFKEYRNKVNDMLLNGFAEKVPTQQLSGSSGKVWYIPHHGIYHPRKKSLRVVFDCSASFKGSSLNEQLLQGPNFNSTLIGVLLRFRQEPVAFMGDVQAMYYQVKVPEEDRDLLRFLWWPEGDLTKDASEFRMTVHLFGAVSSPSCAIFALRKTADDNQAEFPAEIPQTVKENFYVDDCLKSVESEKKAVTMIKHLTTLCQKGGFTLTKWVSNSCYVLQAMPQEYRAKGVEELDMDRDELPMERALGLQWCVQKDTFTFKMAPCQRSCTRRGMLSVSSSVYDPLGFLAPILLPAKIMLQELCRRNYGWDETVPQELLHRWTRWIEELEMLSNFEINRCIKPKDFGTAIHAELHHFSDASELGYGAVTYLRIQNSKNVIHVAFVMGKARVTPLKTVTIPRLELTAAVLAVRMDLMLKKELQIPLAESIFWTDSTSVLKYINNEDRRFHTFVANRVTIIREATTTLQWRYIRSKENPADDASRGLRVGDFIEHNRWIVGPSFLYKSEEDWPADRADMVIKIDDPEIKREVLVNAVSVTDSSDSTTRLIAHFSDWKRLRVAVAWFLKYKRMLQERSHKRKESKTSYVGMQSVPVHERCTLSIEDISEAELAIIRFCQQQRFSEEIATLSAGKGTVSKQSPLYKLDPRLDNGLLRVGGRLARGSLPEEAKHPLILSKDQHIATLLLRNIHERLGHSGRNHILSTLRRKYWITGANSAVRKIMSDCCLCRRQNGRMMLQKMADLPMERILPDKPPFTNTGVDYFGPIEVKKGRGTAKRYGVIFTCLSSRAVHLEIANSLNTDACINAIRRFVCRRGQVVNLLSDNGTNFKGAEKELREALLTLNQTNIGGMLQQKGIKWSFNPPSASHYGGVWERMIRMVRRILSSVLHQQKLDDDGLHTVICEVEAILNDRPITKLSDDPNDLEPLTPNHILLMKGKPSLPPGLFEHHDLYIRKRWRQVQYISDLFWKRWIREYLPLLQERQKWNEQRKNLKPGDIVIIMDPTAPRSSWPLARVLEAFQDKKKIVRSVRLQTKSSIIERPVTKLCLLQESV